MGRPLGSKSGAARRIQVERFDVNGRPIRLMAAADGYVMAQRPGCEPFVLPMRRWEVLATKPPKVAS
ncbi:hypothetical protein [Roseococcus thiosulfatophilus]|uniref:hypothetical protein n=1 Tax=Roseococcus thiosulfatophilus TaxID=35813 RepID=UPI001A903B80|nr:hypothetical protein [Roseococcus thiosulfatophilus]